MESNICSNQMWGSYQKWFIGNQIRALLIADTDIKAQVGTNVYPLVAPEDTKGDFILYQRGKYAKTADMHRNVVMDECKILLFAVAENYDDAVTLASLIDNTLTGTHKTNEGKRFACTLTDSTEDFTDGKYVETLEYQIN